MTPSDNLPYGANAVPSLQPCPRKDCGREQACAAPFADERSACQPIPAVPASPAPVFGTPGALAHERDAEIPGAGGILLHQTGPDEGHPRTDCRPDLCGWSNPSAPSSKPEAPVVDFHQMLGDDDSRGWAIQRQLKEQLGRPYLATQLASMLPHEVAMRLVQRIEELTGPELERRLGQHISDLQADIDNVTADTLVRLAAQADAKRKELTRERFGPSGSRLS